MINLNISDYCQIKARHVIITSTNLSYLHDTTSNLQNQINNKANSTSPMFTRTITGIYTSQVVLGNIDNTSDVNKPISTAVQTTSNSKASEYHVACRASGTSGAMRSYGTFTINTSTIDVSGGKGNYKVTMSTPCPLGGNYGINATVNNGNATIASSSVKSSAQLTSLT